MTGFHYFFPKRMGGILHRQLEVEQPGVASAVNVQTVCRLSFGHPRSTEFEQANQPNQQLFQRSVTLVIIRACSLPACCKTQSRADSFGDGNSQVQGRTTIDQLAK